MIFIRFSKETSSRAKVLAYGEFTNQFPQNDIDVVFTESNSAFPVQEERSGKMGVLFINPTTKEMWYEYEERPLTSEEQIEQLKSENMTLQLALAELGMSAEQDKTETQIAIAELAMLVTGGEL